VREGKGAGGLPSRLERLHQANWDEFEKAVAGGWRAQGFHGPKHVFTVKKTDVKHAISEGLPAQFEHAIDELYQNSVMAPGSVVLATAYSDPKKPRGTGKDEPVIWSTATARGGSTKTCWVTTSRPWPTPSTGLVAPRSDLGRRRRLQTGIIHDPRRIFQARVASPATAVSVATADASIWQAPDPSRRQSASGRADQGADHHR